MKKEIVLGYSDPGVWEGTATPIWPEWYAEDCPSDVASYLPDEVILDSDTKYTLKIDYPLTNPYLGEFITGKNGMTRQEFVDLACKTYQEIYNTEDEDVKMKTPNIPGMYNRSTSNGRFGIWGHDIEDLTIHTLYVDENNVLTLGVDS